MENYWYQNQEQLSIKKFLDTPSRCYFINRNGEAFYVDKSKVKIDERGRFIGDISHLLESVPFTVIFQAKKSFKAVRVEGTYYLTHRLVAEAFLPNYRPRMRLVFVDTNFMNCNIRNIRYVHDVDNQIPIRASGSNLNQASVRKAMALLQAAIDILQS